MPGDADAIRQARRGLLAVGAAAVLWATLGIVVRLLQDHATLTALTILFWRLVLAAAVLLLVIGTAGVRDLLAERHRPARILIASACAIGFQLTYFIAVGDVGVAVATLITLGVAPITAVLVESVRARRRPAVAVLAATACALAGLALVSAAHPDAVVAPRPVRGVALSLASGMMFAGAALTSRRLSARLSPQALTTGTTVLGVAFLVPVALATGPGQLVQVPLTLPVLAGIAHLGIVTSAVAYALFYLGLRSTSGGTAMVVTLLEPATAVLLAALILDEPITALSGTGALLVLAAVAVLYLAPAP